MSDGESALAHTIVDEGIAERVEREDANPMADTVLSTSAFDDTIATHDGRGRPAAAMTTTPGKTVLPRLSRAPDRPGFWLTREERTRYEEQRMLGAGGMGEVVEVMDNDIGREVAMKRLHGRATSGSGLARFVEEVRTIGRLEHPNIIPIHDVGVDADGRYFFIMKKIDGEPLDALINRLASGDEDAHARWSFEARARLVLSILDALSFAHERHIIHRDIKPANVMVGRHGEVVLMDWGLAKEVGAHEIEADDDIDLDHGEVEESVRLKLTHRGDLLGTPAYMSPEQARGETETVDARSDVYSLGVLMHELMTLDHYLADERSVISTLKSVSEREETFATLMTSPHQAAVPAEFSHVIARAMQKDAGARYARAQEMRDGLQAAIDGEFEVQCIVTAMKKSSLAMMRFADKMPRNRGKMQLVVGLLALALVGAVALFAWILSLAFFT